MMKVQILLEAMDRPFYENLVDFTAAKGEWVDCILESIWTGMSELHLREHGIDHE